MSGRKENAELAAAELRTLDVVEDELTGARLSLWEEEQESARLRSALESARRGRRALRARVAELEAERSRYVGREPTTAEEMAHLSRCLDAVYDLCDDAERKGIVSGGPFTVEAVRQAADGDRPAADRPALPWAHVMPDGDLSDFLDDLLSAAMNRWRTDANGPVPDRVTLADVERVCREWRTPGQGCRSDEPEAPYVSRPLPPRDAVCARPDCGHPGVEHHHGDTKCWANLPRTRQPNGAWSAVPICGCEGFVSPLEDPHDSPLHHRYETCHDLPEGGAR